MGWGGEGWIVCAGPVARVLWGCLVLVGNDRELDAVGRQFKPYRWRPCCVTCDAAPEQSWLSKLRRNPAFFYRAPPDRPLCLPCLPPPIARPPARPPACAERGGARTLAAGAGDSEDVVLGSEVVKRGEQIAQHQHQLLCVCVCVCVRARARARLCVCVSLRVRACVRASAVSAPQAGGGGGGGGGAHQVRVCVRARACGEVTNDA